MDGVLSKWSSNVRRCPPQSSVAAAIQMSLMGIGVPAFRRSAEPSVMAVHRRRYRQDRDEGLCKELCQEGAVLTLAAAQLEAGFQFTEDDSRRRTI
jgi:hypothetical protein